MSATPMRAAQQQEVLFEIQGDASGTVLSFCVPSSNRLTLAALQRAFPLPGQWHFRAKVTLPGSKQEYVWQDLISGEEEIPRFGGGGGGLVVHIKAMPVGSSSSPSQQQQCDEEEDWILDDDICMEDLEEACQPSTRVLPPVTTAAAAVTSKIDEQMTRLGNSMFSAFKSVVKNVS